MAAATVTITDNTSGKSVECPVHHGTYGPPVIDTKSVYQELGMFTFDPGFVTTASCKSAITYLDGEQGILLHRGYSIDQLAEHSSYLEVCYLLIYGELPNQAQMDAYRVSINRHATVHERLNRFFSGYRSDAHPMSVMAGVMGALASYYHETMDILDPEVRELTANRVIAKVPTIASNCYRYITGQPFVYPDSNLGYVHNFMRMMFSVPTEDFDISPVAIRALDLLLILHADHEQNASTSTVRLAGSAESNPFACVAAGIATLWGRAHGGANEAVVLMLEQMGGAQNIPAFIARAKDKDDPFRLMGFGHRVYKNFDPRAVIIREACHALLDSLDGIDQPTFETAMELERIALEDDYFIERKLYPNVDFYSGIILKALDIPMSMFTVIFALARSAGWIAQWIEMISDEERRIGRPRQLYVGGQQRDYVSIDKR